MGYFDTLSQLQPNTQPVTQADATKVNPPRTKLFRVRFQLSMTEKFMPCIHHMVTCKEIPGNSQTTALHKIQSIAVARARELANLFLSAFTLITSLYNCQTNAGFYPIYITLNYFINLIVLLASATSMHSRQLVKEAQLLQQNQICNKTRPLL